mmetsp:Transcript_4239/g.15891  ORF Transcript_4239/g.15891 Transcript_4239/m.15891 type:complete len:372 (+) Transcript_4239:1657-2772(+)
MSSTAPASSRASQTLASPRSAAKYSAVFPEGSAALMELRDGPSCSRSRTTMLKRPLDVATSSGVDPAVSEVSEPSTYDCASTPAAALPPLVREALLGRLFSVADAATVVREGLDPKVPRATARPPPPGRCADGDSTAACRPPPPPAGPAAAPPPAPAAAGAAGPAKVEEMPHSNSKVATYNTQPKSHPLSSTAPAAGPALSAWSNLEAISFIASSRPGVGGSLEAACIAAPRGHSPRRPVRRGQAPASRSRRTMSTSPCLAAQKRGVSPALSGLSASAPSSSSLTTAAPCWPRAALQSGVGPPPAPAAAALPDLLVTPPKITVPAPAPAVTPAAAPSPWWWSSSTALSPLHSAATRSSRVTKPNAAAQLKV